MESAAGGWVGMREVALREWAQRTLVGASPVKGESGNWLLAISCQ